ncbi:hypothetical protein M529_02680 [Sphingobium ummariense RL-3]|uniref:Uncharacterized protein n=1 Tax=Sphingobium ummariense RL-3 TaxID=1346791 RepID=T0J7I2_9SPHN|nr:hypothetical protein M529_02680 [Sphingobium ummariense RL-3]
MQLRFRTLNIRPATRKFRRQPDRDGFGKRRQRQGFLKRRIERTRRFTQQQRQCVHQCIATLKQFRKHCVYDRDLAPSGCDVKASSHSVALSTFREGLYSGGYLLITLRNSDLCLCLTEQ